MGKTIQAHDNPGSRLSVGGKVLNAAVEQTTTTIKSDLSGFAKRHAAYVAAETVVVKTEKAKRAQEKKVAEAEVELDEQTAQLGADLSSDGLPKGNPFKPLGPKMVSPSDMKALGHAAKATLSHKLVKAPIATLEKAHIEAIQKREALSQPWETCLATLKSGAEYSDNKHGTKLYAALFQGAPAKPKSKPKTPGVPKSKKKKKGKGTEPEPTGGGGGAA